MSPRSGRAAVAFLFLATSAHAAEVARPVAASPTLPALADLPSLDLTLTPPRLETLRQILTAAPQGFSPESFRAYVEADPAAAQQVMAGQKKGSKEARLAMTAMYNGMLRVARRGGLPFEERAALTSILARRYAAYLGAMAGAPRMPAPTRAVAQRMRDRLQDGSVTRGLLYADQVHHQAQELVDAVKPLRRIAAGEIDPEAKTGPWRIPPPVPSAERTRQPGKKRVLVEALPQMARVVRDQMTRLSQRRERLALMAQRGSSLRLRLKELSSFDGFIDKLWAEARDARTGAQRAAETSIRKTLVKGKAHSIIRVPANKGLQLIPKRGGFLLKARFKSSINDRRVWEVVKGSIEQEWRGRFKYGGKTYYLRTEVSVEPLADGEKAGTDFLILKEGQGAASHAGEDGITLTRDFHYLTPAHEFGHVVGLPDEYSEVYDFDAMAVTHSAPMASLMANSKRNPGLILPRHLKLAYQLLRRHRLVLPEVNAVPGAKVN